MVLEADNLERGYRLKAPIHANFEITKRCNHLCEHCYNGIRDGPISEEYFPPEHFKKIMQRLCDWGIFSVAISGGEPFLRKDVMGEILKIAKNENIDISINSNLTYMPPTSLLKDNPHAAFLVSIFSSEPKKHDTITRREGSLIRTVANIEKIVKEYHNPIGINCVINKNNLEDLYETGKLASEIGASCFSVTAMISTYPSLDNKKISPSETREMLLCLHKIEQDFGIYTDTLLPIVPCLYWDVPELRKYFSRTCSAGRGSINIASSGDISTCFHYTDKSQNILNANLNEVWRDMSKSEINAKLFEECNRCVISESCRGGCRKDREYLIQNLNPLPILNNFVQMQEIPPRFKIKIGDDIKFREEKKGTVLIYRKQRIAEISEDTLDIIQNAQTQSILDIDRLNKNSKLFLEMEILLKEGFITIGGI